MDAKTKRRADVARPPIIKSSGSDNDDDEVAHSSPRQTKKARRHDIPIKKEEEEAKPDSVFSSTEDPQEQQRVLVEFQFRSYKTQLFPKEGALKGTLRVEMDQDPASGRYSIPVGDKTPFTIELQDVASNSWCMGAATGANTFQGSFSRSTAAGPITMKDTGLVLDYATGNHRNFKVTVRPHKEPRRSFGYRDVKFGGTQSFQARDDDLNEWEENQGGFLELVAPVSTEWYNDVRWGYYGGTFPETRAAEGTHKIKLYTVLSAHRPGEGSLPKYIRGKSPDWDTLIHVVAARFPDQSASWAERAVRQYRYFMELKVDPKLAKQKFSPSYLVDEIWHAHLSFPERYQRDMVCLTMGNGIVEHMPVNFKRAAKDYERSHAQHSKRMKKLDNTAVDKEFWPDPVPYDPSEHVDSSDDEKLEGWLVQGKPSSSSNACCGCCG